MTEKLSLRLIATGKTSWGTVAEKKMAEMETIFGGEQCSS